MALLVTGASGHVGGAVVAQALAQGLDVLAVHRASTPPQRLAGATWASCDLADPRDVQALVSAYAIDACIHAAAVSNEAYARPAPRAAINTNIGATANLLEAARLQHWRRLVFVSTGSVFQQRGDLVTPILEDEPPAPGNVYSTTKAAAESIVRMYRSEYGLSAATVRISWVFGPPVVTDSPTRGPIPSFLARALRGAPIREGGGAFAASFTYIDDVAAGLLATVASPALRHPCYHLGPGRNVSAREVASAVLRAVPGAVIELADGTEPWTRFTAMRAPLAGSRLLDDTGFVPRYPVEPAIELYAQWLRQRAL